MKARWQQLTRWFDTRTLRERGILLLCCVLVLGTLAYVFVLTPSTQRHGVMRQQISTMQQEIAALTETIQTIRQRDQQDPDIALRARREELETQVAKQRRQLSDGMAQLVTSQEMPQLLRQMLNRQQNLTLMSLENLSPELLTQAAEEAGEGAPVVYRHGLQMEMQGDYLSVLEYLRSLESLPRSVVWEEIELVADDYPQATIRFEVYTLGLTKGWLGG